MLTVESPDWFAPDPLHPEAAAKPIDSTRIGDWTIEARDDGCLYFIGPRGNEMRLWENQNEKPVKLGARKVA